METYRPFSVFRDRLSATGSVDTAAQQTKALLDLDAHREEVKDTLISLGTYTSALRAEGGGRYSASDEELSNQIQQLALYFTLFFIIKIAVKFLLYFCLFSLC